MTLKEMEEDIAKCLKVIRVPISVRPLALTRPCQHEVLLMEDFIREVAKGMNQHHAAKLAKMIIRLRETEGA